MNCWIPKTRMRRNSNHSTPTRRDWRRRKSRTIALPRREVRKTAPELKKVLELTMGRDPGRRDADREKRGAARRKRDAVRQTMGAVRRTTDVVRPTTGVGLPKMDAVHLRMDVARQTMGAVPPKTGAARPTTDVVHPKMDAAHPKMDVGRQTMDAALPKMGAACLTTDAARAKRVRAPATRDQVLKMVHHPRTASQTMRRRRTIPMSQRWSRRTIPTSRTIPMNQKRRKMNCSRADRHNAAQTRRVGIRSTPHCRRTATRYGPFPAGCNSPFHLVNYKPTRSQNLYGYGLFQTCSHH